MPEFTRLRNQVEMELEITTTLIGNNDSLQKEVKILGRCLVWHRDIGVSYEADPRHAEVIVRDTGAESMSALRTPILREAGESDEERAQDALSKKRVGKVKDMGCAQGGEKLSPEDTTKFLALAARANFLAIDRGYLLYCAKE